MTRADRRPSEVLAAVPEASWRRLWAAYDAVLFERPERHMEMRGGQRTGTTADGHAVISMPWASYSPAVRELRAAVGEAAAFLPHLVAAMPTSDPLKADDPAELLAGLALVVRRERFIEGLFGSRLRHGSVLRALYEVRRWHDHHVPRQGGR